MLVTYHLHTSLSGDGSGSHEDYIKTAIEKNIDEIGFSEHLCFKKPDWSIDPQELPLMVKKVNALKESSAIPIKLGIELDYNPEFEEEIKKVTATYPFDYVIGVVHYIGDWVADDPRYIAEYKKRDINEVYKQYFSLIQKAANSQFFDIIGHPDLIKKYGFRPKKSIDNLLKDTAEVFKRNKVVIEINTGGLAKPCKEIYPSKKFLKICFNEKIPITLGSDAHVPEDVGRYFDEAIRLAKEVGYTKIVQFTKRKRKLI